MKRLSVKRLISWPSNQLLYKVEKIGGELKSSFKTKAFIAKNALDMKKQTNNQISHGSSVQDNV